MPTVHFAGRAIECPKGANLGMALPPHHRDSGLRLACRCSVLGEIEVTKYDGLFGQRAEP